MSVIFTVFKERAETHLIKVKIRCTNSLEQIISHSHVARLIRVRLPETGPMEPL